MNKVIRRVVLGLAVALLPGGAALASFSQNALTNGGVIQWAGDATNVNQIYANYGGALVWDNGHGVTQHTPIDGAPWITKVTVGKPTAIFCDDTGGGQLPNKVYYVYYAGYAAANSPTGYWHVISTTAPTAEGFPSGANGISYTIVPKQHEVGSKAAIFLGSYVTDMAGDMVPFERNGEEVILAPKLGPPMKFESLQAPAFVAPYTSQQVTFTNDIPASATALIVDLTVTSLAPAGDLFVLDPTPNYNGVVFNAGCQLYSQYDLHVLAGGTTWVPHVRVKTLGGGSGVVNFGVCAPQQFQVTASYVGYVEPIHHLF